MEQSEEGRKASEEKVGPAFLLTIDSLRMLPDNAVGAKVAGKVFNLPNKDESGSFTVFPEMDWPYRSPRCLFSKVFNAGLRPLSSNLVLMLKIFTVDRTTGKVAFLGCSVMELVDKKTNKLKAGGHQIKLFSGLPPPPKGGPLALRESDTASLPVLPGTSIVLRILHHDDQPSPRPHYRSGYYASPQSPSPLESKLHQHYFSFGDYPTRLSSAISMLSANESGSTEAEEWMRVHLEETARAPDYDRRLFNRNHPGEGVHVKVVGASGLGYPAEETFIQCQVELVGKDVKPGTQFLTQKLDFSSYQRHPRWLDPPSLLTPGSKEKSVALLARLWGASCANLKVASKTTYSDQSNYTFSFSKTPTLKPLAWGVCPLFVQDCVDAGSHVIPLFSGSPPEAFLKMLTNRGASPLLVKFAVKKELAKPSKTGAVLKLQVTG